MAATDTSKMSDQARLPKSEAFYFDARHLARSTMWILVGFLFFVLLALRKEMESGGALGTDGLFGVWIIGAMLFATGIGALRKTGRNDAVMIVTPDGVSFPSSRIAMIPWDRVERIELRRNGFRYGTAVNLRFQFMPGTIEYRRWLKLHKDRLEVVLAIRSYMGRAVSQGLTVPPEEVAESVSRFFPVIE